MQLPEFLTAIVLLCIAVCIFSALVYQLAGPFLHLFRGGTDNAKLKRARGKLEQVDALLSNHRPLEALKLLKKAVYFDEIGAYKHISAIKEHHQNFLSRCLIIAEELDRRPRNIAEIEQLFLERSELQILQIRVTESYQNIRFRREKAGKGVPDWSKADFEQRLKQIKEELGRNKNSLTEELNELFKALGTQQSSDQLYH